MKRSLRISGQRSLKPFLNKKRGLAPSFIIHSRRSSSSSGTTHIPGPINTVNIHITPFFQFFVYNSKMNSNNRSFVVIVSIFLISCSLAYLIRLTLRLYYLYVRNSKRYYQRILRRKWNVNQCSPKKWRELIDNRIYSSLLLYSFILNIFIISDVWTAILFKKNGLIDVF